MTDHVPSQPKPLQAGDTVSLAAFIEYVFSQKPRSIGFQTAEGFLLDWTSRDYWAPVSNSNWLELLEHHCSIHVEACGDYLLEEDQRSFAYLMEPGKEADEVFGVVVERS